MKIGTGDGRPGTQAQRSAGFFARGGKPDVAARKRATGRHRIMCFGTRSFAFPGFRPFAFPGSQIPDPGFRLANAA